MTQHWFVGWDTREGEAYDVCVHSLLRHASCDVVVHPIKHRELRKAKLFWREWRIDADGRFWDIEDGKPFSTEFAHSRFLTPYLAKRAGVDGWCFFVDADFLFMDDVAKLEPLLDNGYAACCVKHKFKPSAVSKMDGQIQSRYSRKNWSSLIAFDTRHTANDRLTPECVSTADGGWLHGFGWLKDDQIGALPGEWNRLVGHFSPDTPVAALHYTDGGPWFDEWPVSDFDRYWLEERAMMQHPAPVVRQKQLDAVWGPV